jgi:D-3-phosphoglycerate dehydrogenase
VSKTILYLGPADLTEHVRTCLGDGFAVHHADTDAATDAVLPAVDAVLDALMRIRFPADRIARARRLRAYVTATTGADHVDAAALATRNIPLLTLKGRTDVLRNITPAAELSWLLLMACARKLRGAVRHVLDGGWDRNLFPGVMLRGRTIGIVGCGRIGQWMGRYAEAFGLRRLGFDPHLPSADWPAHIEPCPLEDLLRQCDFLTIHVPLTDETRGLIGPRELACMKPTAAVVNTSRGGIVDESALLAALRDGRIAAAGLDVLDGEPDTARHPLVEYARTHDNLVITPHIGGMSPDALRYVLEFSAGRVREALAVPSA